MADQLFHRRNAKRADALRREAQKREPYDVVLIVCEGGKTEPKYLQELRDALQLPPLYLQRLTSGHVPRGLPGSAPLEPDSSTIAGIKQGVVD